MEPTGVPKRRSINTPGNKPEKQNYLFVDDYDNNDITYFVAGKQIPVARDVHLLFTSQ
jgi:hypothetical protein